MIWRRDDDIDDIALRDRCGVCHDALDPILSVIRDGIVQHEYHGSHV
jgi:hypothetical protein